ncbi:uncharacterized protein LOC143285442 [Babylonia areolata]|uniref:uncharacterized protein LOC143285442 n=1 Tax=Babylonia areolata TaxID=304850 RepID=UPI003FCF8FE8
MSEQQTSAARSCCMDLSIHVSCQSIAVRRPGWPRTENTHPDNNTTSHHHAHQSLVLEADWPQIHPTPHPITTTHHHIPAAGENVAPATTKLPEPAEKTYPFQPTADAAVKDPGLDRWVRDLNQSLLALQANPAAQTPLLTSASQVCDQLVQQLTDDYAHTEVLLKALTRKNRSTKEEQRKVLRSYDPELRAVNRRLERVRGVKEQLQSRLTQLVASPDPLQPLLPFQIQQQTAERWGAGARPPTPSGTCRDVMVVLYLFSVVLVMDKALPAAWGLVLFHALLAWGITFKAVGSVSLRRKGVVSVLDKMCGTTDPLRRVRESSMAEHLVWKSFMANFWVCWIAFVVVYLLWIVYMVVCGVWATFSTVHGVWIYFVAALWIWITFVARHGVWITFLTVQCVWITFVVVHGVWIYSVVTHDPWTTARAVLWVWIAFSAVFRLWITSVAKHDG